MASFCLYFVLGAFQLLFLSFGTSGNSSSPETPSCSTVCPSSSFTVSGALTSSVILSTTQTNRGNSTENTTSFSSVTPSVTPIPTSTLSSSLLTNSSTSLLNNTTTAAATTTTTTTTTASSNSTAKQTTPLPTANTITSTKIATPSDSSTTTSASSSLVIRPSPSRAPVVTSTGSADTIASTPATVSPDSTWSSFNGSQSTIVTPSPTVTGAGASSSSQFTLLPTSASDSISVTSTTTGQNTTEVSPTNATAFIPSTSAELSTMSPLKTKSINMKVTLDMEFKEDYKDTSSDAYIELKKNVTNELEKVFKNTEGFVRIEIYSFRKGSVICDFDVFLNESASVKGEDLKKTLQEASKNGLGSFKVINIEVKDEKTDEKTKEVLPLWAMVTLILLGALGLVLLITIIILAVLYKRAKESGPLYQVSGDEWAHYESMSMGDYRVRAEQVDRRRLRNGDNNQPVYANHPVSHSNLTYEVPANGE